MLFCFVLGASEGAVDEWLAASTFNAHSQQRKEGEREESPRLSIDVHNHC